MGATYKIGVRTPAVGFYKMAAHTFRCVDVECAIGMACNPFCRKNIFAILMMEKKTPTHFVENFVEPTAHFVEIWGAHFEERVCGTNNPFCREFFGEGVISTNGSKKWGTCGLYKMGSLSIWPPQTNTIQHAYFFTEWVYPHTCSPRWWSLQNGCWKFSGSTNSQSTSREELYKMTLSFKERGRSTKWCLVWPNPTYPQKRWISFYFMHDPIRFVEETGGGIHL